jgi:tetratricopeptide (TPR) repeat protein
MAALATDQKLIEFGERLTDLSVDLSELEIRGIMHELDAMSGRDHGLDALLFGLRALCYVRMSRPDKAMEQNKLALQRARDPGMRAQILSNQSGVLLTLGRPKEAAMAAVEAARIGHVHLGTTLGNLAEALVQLGERDAALDVFADAVEVTEFTNAARTFSAAVTAADIGCDADAVEFFARFVILREDVDRGNRSALDVIASASSSTLASYSQKPALRSTIRRAMAFAAERARQSTVEDLADDEQARAEAMGVFEATKPLRDTAVALRLGGNGGASTGNLNWILT